MDLEEERHLTQPFHGTAIFNINAASEVDVYSTICMECLGESVLYNLYTELKRTQQRTPQLPS